MFRFRFLCALVLFLPAVLHAKENEPERPGLLCQALLDQVPPEVELVDMKRVSAPIPDEVLEVFSDLKIDLGRVVADVYDVYYDPRLLFTRKQYENFRRFSAVEAWLNRGLVVVTAPVWVPLAAVTALLVKIDSPGPVFFVQDRVGKGAKLFQIYKFRTMRADAEGPTHTRVRDARVTRLGRFLRRMKLDEIPQLFNILKGDMNIVGRRPLVPEEAFAALKTDPKYGWGFFEKPGLTSLGQISCDHCSSPEQNLGKFKYDLFAMVNKGRMMFLATVLGTVHALVKGTGAR